MNADWECRYAHNGNIFRTMVKSTIVVTIGFCIHGGYPLLKNQIRFNGPCLRALERELFLPKLLPDFSGSKPIISAWFCSRKNQLHFSSKNNKLTHIRYAQTTPQNVSNLPPAPCRHSNTSTSKIQSYSITVTAVTVRSFTDNMNIIS